MNNTIENGKTAETLEIFVNSIDEADKEYMMRYDLACLQDAVRIVKRIDSIRAKRLVSA